MNTRPSVQLKASELTLIKDILRSHLSSAATVWAFGSRTQGKVKPYSDLDLLISNAGKPLSLQESGALREAFEEAALTIKVEFADCHQLSSEFLTLIQNDLVPILVPVSDS